MTQPHPGRTPTLFSAVRCRLPAWTGVALLLLGGCGATKTYYPGAAEQQQRAIAEAANSPSKGAAADATVNTQGTYLKLIEQMQRDGIWFASLAHIDALEQRWGSSAESTRLRADALRQTGQLAESKKMYGKLMGTPLEAAGYHGQGLLAGSQADYPQAVRMLEQAQRRNPTDGLLLSDLGYANLRAGRIVDARIPLMQAMQLKPDSTQVQVNLALYLQASGQQDQANALMDAHNFPPATRAAIRETARELASGKSLPTTAVAVATVPLPDDGNPSLALKASSWPLRVQVPVQARTPATEPGSSASELTTTTPPAGGQP